MYKEDINMYTVYDVTHWFLHSLDGITNKKLQKLVYYAYSWHLVFNNERADDIVCRMFENKFEAWVHGAVHPRLYAIYENYGSNIIPKYNGILPEFSEDDLDVLRQVLDIYGRFSGDDLESICRQESPWLDARKNLAEYEPSHEPITDRAIFNCYSKRL